MTLEIVLTLAAIAVLIALSAFFNGSETALTAASRARMHALEQEGNIRAATVNRLLSTPEKMIGAILLGNTLVDVLAAALASGLAVRLVGDVGVVYATVIMTVLIVIFGAVLPKTYALAFSDRLALFVSPFMRGVVSTLSPLTKAIEVIVRLLLKLTPSKEDDAANILAAHEEIRGTIDLQAKEGTVLKHDAEMLGGVLDLRDLQVADIMIHRTKMETLDADSDPQDIIDEILQFAVYAHAALEGRTRKHRRCPAHQGPADRARPRRLGCRQARYHEFRAGTLVRPRHHEPEDTAQPVPEKESADGACRR